MAANHTVNDAAARWKHELTVELDTDARSNNGQTMLIRTTSTGGDRTGQHASMAGMAEGAGEEGGDAEANGERTELEQADRDALAPAPPSAGTEELTRLLSAARERLRIALSNHSAHSASLTSARSERDAALARADALAADSDAARADSNLVGARLHDGTLDLLRGQRLSQCSAQLERERESRSCAEREAQRLQECLEDERTRRSSSESAAKEELHSLALEASQCRLSAQARKREASEEAARAREADERAQNARSAASDAEQRAERERVSREEAERLKAEAEAESERAQAAEQQAEARREEAELQAAEASKHAEWLESRVSELTSSDWHKTNEKHEFELRQVRTSLEQEKLRLQGEVSAERQRRHELEYELEALKEEQKHPQENEHIQTLEDVQQQQRTLSAADGSKDGAAPLEAHEWQENGHQTPLVQHVDRAVGTEVESIPEAQMAAKPPSKDAAVQHVSPNGLTSEDTGRKQNAQLLSAANSEIARLKDVNERLSNDVQNLRERLKHMQRDMDSKLEKAEGDFNEKASEVDHLKQEKERLEGELKHAKEEREVEAMAAALDASAAAESAAEKRISELRKSLHASQQQRQRTESLNDAEAQTSRELLNDLLAQERLSATVEVQKARPSTANAQARRLEDERKALCESSNGGAANEQEESGVRNWERGWRRRSKIAAGERSPRESIEAPVAHANGHPGNHDEDFVRMSIEDDCEEYSNGRAAPEDETTPEQSTVSANGKSPAFVRNWQRSSAADTPLRELAASKGSGASASAGASADGTLSSVRASREMRKQAMEQAQAVKDMAESASKREYVSPSPARRSARERRISQKRASRSRNDHRE